MLTASCFVVFSQADAGKDTTICTPGSPVTIGTEDNPDYCYTWESSDGTFSSKLATPEVSPTVTTTYYLTVTGPNFSFTDEDDVTVSVYDIESVTFEEDQSSLGGYGFDDKSSDGPWISVATLSSTTAIVKTNPPSEFKGVYLADGEESFYTLVNRVPSSGEYTFGIQVYNTGEGTIEARCGTKDGPLLCESCSLKVAVYDILPITLSLVEVREDDEETSVPIPFFAPALELYLDHAYAQACVEWSVTIEPSVCELNFNLNNNPILDMPEESDLIISGCPTGTGKTLFFPNMIIDHGALGFNDIGNNYGFISLINIFSEDGHYDNVLSIIAHELGHSLGLSHPQFNCVDPGALSCISFVDHQNLMTGKNCWSQRDKLRKCQWDIIR